MPFIMAGRRPFVAKRLDVIDSPKRCPWDGRRMVQECATSLLNTVHIIHQCPHCLYSEED